MAVSLPWLTPELGEGPLDVQLITGVQKSRHGLTRSKLIKVNKYGGRTGKERRGAAPLRVTSSHQAWNWKTLGMKRQTDRASGLPQVWEPRRGLPGEILSQFHLTQHPVGLQRGTEATGCGLTQPSSSCCLLWAQGDAWQRNQGVGQPAVAAQDGNRGFSLRSTLPRSQGARTGVESVLKHKSGMKCQLGGNFLPFVSCHSWLPIFLRCLQFPRD